MFTKNLLPDSNLADDPVFALLESFPEEALLIDLKGIILNANNLFAARFNISAEECIGANVYDLIANELQLPELALHYREKIADVLRTGKRMVFENRKEDFIWKFTINPVLSSEKKIARLFITIADISGQNRMKVRLDENKTRFNQALEAARAGVWEWDLATNENDWSDEIWHLYGLEPSKTISPSFQIWASVIHPDDLESTINAVTETAKCETELNVEYRVCYPDGSTHWLMARGKPLRDPNGKAVRYIGTIIDITERKKTEQTIIDTKSKLDATLHSIRDAVIISDSKGVFINFNDAFATFHKFSTIDECVKNFEEYPKILDVFQDNGELLPVDQWVLLRALRGESGINEEYTMRRKDTGETWIGSYSYGPICNNDEQIIGSIVTVRDITDQKQKEKALKESENSFRMLFERHSSIMLVIEPDTGRIIDVNQAAVNFYKWPSETLKQMTIQQITADPLFCKRNQIHRTADGSIHDVEVFSCSIPVYGKEMLYAIINDITERIMTEQALVSSEKKFRSMAEQIAEIVFITDQYGIVNYVSPAVDPISGYTTDEVIGHPFVEFVFEEDIERAVSSFQIGLSNNVSDEMLELRYKKKDGSLFYAEIHVQYYEHQEFIGYIGLIRDISNRKKFEQELVESKEFLKNIYDKVNYSIFVVDVLPDGSYRFKGINPLHETVIGIGSEEANGKRPEQLFSPACAESLMHHYDDCIRAGHSIQYEESVRFKGNDSFWETVLNPIHNENGTIFRIIGTSIDITERKQIEEERAELGVQLQQSQKMEMVGRLAGGIAHDFNNMLTVILGHSEMGMEQIDPTLTTYADFNAIHRAATHSANLTRQLLAFARKQIVTPIFIELNTAITEMLPMLRRLIGENITLIWTPQCKNCFIKIDPSQIDQILVNLCINARDAITGNGKITVENRCVSLPEIACETRKTECLSGDYVSLSVHDDGCGIEPNDLQHIFEPFFTTKETGKGTGLGLSTVYGIVKQNNGNIECLSEPGKGTTFTIHLPKHKVQEATNLNKQQEQLIQKGLQTILLVEDEPGILKLCKLILERNGYTVLAFENAGYAIKMAEHYQGKIDLLVTDVMMPEMNGSELSKKLLATRPDLKILFISGYTADVIAHNTILDSRLNFMQKPFNSKALTTIVYNILNSELLQESVVE
jgi:two-component system, cell cycle sensor histidine kinase and response regulator CckA